MSRGLDTSQPVVVLKLVRNLYAHGGLGIIRTLGRLGVPVWAVHEDHNAPAARSRYAKTVLWDLGSTPADAAVNRLRELAAEIGRPAILIPTDDVSSLMVDDCADELSELFVFPRQPRGLARRLSSKAELHGVAASLGVGTPLAEFPRSAADVTAFVERATFPVVVKSIDSEVLAQRPAARSVVIVRTAEELMATYEAMEDPRQPNLMLQEYIPGGPESIWMFNGYFDAQSDCLFGVTGHKIRQHPPHTGATTLGVVRSNDEVLDASKRLLQAVGYRGIVDLGFRYDARDGSYKLLDVNPRVGATFRLFTDETGNDVIRVMYADLTGQPIHCSPAQEGKKWLVENLDLSSSRRYRKEGTLTIAGWVRSLRGVRETAWFARDDLLPFLVMCLWSAPPGVRRLIRRLRDGPGRARRDASRDPGYPAPDDQTAPAATD